MRIATLLLAGAVLGACTKAKPAAPRATDAECTAYRNQLFSLLPETERAGLGKSGMGTPSPKELELCRERVHPDEIACVVKATTLDEALACTSAIDDRPDAVKRTPAECEAYRAHLLEMAEVAASENAFGPPLTKAMAKIAGRECERWMSKKRYDCVMSAKASAAFIQCPSN